jgi:hypothetical protein
MIINFGGIIESSSHWKLDDIATDIKRGISNPTWFYFEPTRKFRKMLDGSSSR